MRCERIGADGDAAALVARMRAEIPAPGEVTDAVAAIIGRVRSEGEAAVKDLTRQHDTGGAEPPPLRVTEGELDAAADGLDGALRLAIETAFTNIHEATRSRLRPPQTVIDHHHHRLVQREEPVHRAAVYAPGGRAPYPSTVVMGVAAARAAGVTDVVVCSPPGRTGTVHPAILAACRLTGAQELYRMGGAQAVAALALGTVTVEPVDVIVGPGNLYVQEAKRQLSGHVGIDSFAGPSDLLVIADGGVDPELIALDLLAQAEHGAGTLVVAASTSVALLEEVADRLAPHEETGAVARLVALDDDEQALELAETFAPEHLELIGPQAEELAPRITRAGCLFVGPGSATAFGDYIVGSNHILPTNGAARFASALTADHFRRSFTEVRVSNGTELARIAAPLARAEGFELHARSMEARIRDNRTP